MNRINITGRLTKAPELRTISSGTQVAQFTVANNIGHDDKKKTSFFPVVVWGKLAETCGKYLDKGKMVGIDGSISIRAYEDKNGQKRSITEITAESVDFLSPAEAKEITPPDDVMF